MFTPVRGRNSDLTTPPTVINMETGLDDTPVFNPRSSQNYSRVTNVPSISDKVSLISSVNLGAGHLKRSCNWTGHDSQKSQAKCQIFFQTGHTAAECCLFATKKTVRNSEPKDAQRPG